MTQAIATKLVEVQTCADCPYFQSHQEPRYIEIEDGSRIPNSRYGAGWCRLFDQFCKEHHKQAQNCINSSDTIISHEEDNLAVFPNVDLEELEPFPTEEAESKLDRPYSEYEVGSIVKVIDKDEHHTEWEIFEIIECKYNQSLYRTTEYYLNEAAWYFRLASNNDATTISKSLWVRENEICYFDQAHNICTQEVF